MKRAIRRIPWLLIILLTITIYSWWRSHRIIDMSLVFLHDGAAQGLVAQDGVLIAAVSNVRFGPEFAYTVGWVSEYFDDWGPGGPTFLLYFSVREHEFRGFSIGVTEDDVYGAPGAWCAYVS